SWCDGSQPPWGLRGAIAPLITASHGVGVLVESRRRVVLRLTVVETDGAGQYAQRTVGGVDIHDHVPAADQVAVEGVGQLLDGADGEAEGAQALLPLRRR